MHEDDDLILPIDETTDTTNPVTRPPRRRISLIVAVVVTLAAFAIGGLLGMFSQARADTPVHVAQSDNVQFLKDLYDQIRYERWYAAEEFALAAVPSDTVLKEADKGDLQAQRQVTQSVEANSITNTLHSDCLDLEMFYNHAAELTAQLPGGSDALRANNLPFNIPIPLPDNFCWTGDKNSFVPGYAQAHSPHHHR